MHAAMERGCAGTSLQLAAALQHGVRWLLLLLLSAAAVVLVWVIASAERCTDTRAVRLNPSGSQTAAAGSASHVAFAIAIPPPSSTAWRVDAVRARDRIAGLQDVCRSASLV